MDKQLSRGVLYLNHGEKCMVRLLVSLDSLRRHYSGPVTLVAVGPQVPEFLSIAGHYQVNVLPVPDDGMAPLVRKAHLWQVSPYDVTMFLDADTLVRQPIDEYFDKIEQHKFCTGNFAGWRSAGGTISRRIRRFRPLEPAYIDAAIQYGPATNTGIFGFTKDAPILPEWASLTRRAYDGGHDTFIPDEVACQVLLPRYPHWLAPVEWGTSVKYGALGDAIRIVHYHGKKHVLDFPLCSLWKQAYWSIRHSLHRRELAFFSKPWHDRRLRRYLRSVSADITVATAVDSKYLPALRQHLPLWQQADGLYQYPMVCFVHGIGLADPSLDFIRRRARLVAWDLPEAANQRERMLSAFVLGAAAEISTKWWLKIDADTKPTPESYRDFSYRLDFPKAAWRAELCGHPWGYTKSKGGYAGRHFLNILDDWWQEKTGEPPVFPPNLPERARFGHARIASFICLHRSEFVQKVAKMCGKRLPIPSHDSLLWFCATRLKAPVVRHNFKRRGWVP